MSQLLNEMDGIESLINVIVIAATNKPDLIVNLNYTIIHLLKSFRIKHY